jgi:thioredoxin-like negative regulator of GroEL
MGNAPSSAHWPPRESPREQQRGLARALAARDRHCLLYFYSSACPLCAAVAPEVAAAGAAGGALAVAPIRCDANDQAAWAPEMMHYGVQRVPCFVLLAPGGAAPPLFPLFFRSPHAAAAQ